MPQVDPSSESGCSVASPVSNVSIRAALDDKRALDQSLCRLLEGADEWVVSLDTARVLAVLVDTLRPSSVLEFGAARSSIVLAHELSRAGGGRLTSIEHQPQYSREAWAKVERCSEVDPLLVESSLRLSLSRNGLLYEDGNLDRILAERGPFGLVFIDAPPGYLGRDATLFRAMRFLDNGAVIVLDDAARPQEQTAMRRWARSIQLEVIVTGIGSRGAAVLRIAGAGTPRFSVRTFLGTLHDRYQQWRYEKERPLIAAAGA